LAGLGLAGRDGFDLAARDLFRPEGAAGVAFDAASGTVTLKGLGPHSPRLVGMRATDKSALARATRQLASLGNGAPAEFPAVVLDQHFETFQQVYDERFAAKYGFWRPIVERSVKAFLKCGDLHQGFARVRCPDCRHEMFVARVPACGCCKQRCTCPSCHQKRALLTSLHVA
jgi:hypothetical protein